MTWRSIKDDPPPTGEEVLVFWQYVYHGDKHRTCGHEIGALSQDGRFWDHEGGHSPGFFTHWMPLPEPPDA